MSSNHYNLVFKVYVTTLASTLHHDLLKSIPNLDLIDGPGLYINKIKSYCNSLNSTKPINQFINLYSDMYNAYIKKENNKLKKIKEFIHSWYPLNSSNNIVINNNYVNMIAKVNINTIKILLNDHFIGNARNHVQAYIRSHDEKYHNEVRNFEKSFTEIVYNSVKISCSKIKNNIDEDSDNMVPASQYIAVVRELEKLKKERNVKLIEELRAEIESLKSELEMAKITEAL